MGDACQHGRIGNFVSIQMQNRQDSAIRLGIQKLVGMPGRGQWPRFRLAVTDDAGRNQIRIIKYCAKCVAERIPQFSTFVYGPRALRRRMAGYTAGKRKLGKQFSESFLIAADVRVHLRISTFEISIGYHRRPTMPRPGDVDRVEIVLFDHPVQMRVNKILPRCCAPMTE